MGYEERVLDFLAKPENLPLAFEISEYVSILIEKTHLQFYELFSDEMQSRLSGSDFNEDWKFSHPNQDRWAKSWEKFSIQPRRTRKKDEYYLIISMEQGRPDNDFILSAGVHWRPVEPKFPVRIPQGLLVKLKTLGLSRSNNFYPGFQYLPDPIRSQEFVLKFHRFPEEVVGNLADQLWEIFETLHSDLDEFSVLNTSQ
jgi:hypothetical protein